jgi:tRNA pseudouridine55 synthase
MIKHGIVVINKERDYTSHDVTAVVKRTLRMKAGHTGTLDPMAEGVLPVCVGTATKLAAYLSSDDKTYVASLRLGVTTDTGDIYGSELTRSDVVFDGERIAETIASFTGEQLQIPPMYSAIKVNGKKLYELARKGQVIEREPRRVFIDSISILEYFPELNAVTIEVNCSKGTYIRSLCADIGERLGCGACMGTLLRTRSGRFDLTRTVKVKELTTDNVIGVEDALPYPRATALPEAEKLAANGNPILCGMVMFEGAEGMYWLYSSGELRGLYTLRDGKFVPEVML